MAPEQHAFIYKIRDWGIPKHLHQLAFHARSIIRNHGVLSIVTDCTGAVFVWQKIYVELVNTEGFMVWSFIVIMAYFTKYKEN
jgi:hypothetical protein